MELTPLRYFRVIAATGHMTRAARKKVEGSYSIQTMARQHLGLFRSLTEAAPGGRNGEPGAGPPAGPALS